jgi:hypothetical protein
LRKTKQQNEADDMMLEKNPMLEKENVDRKINRTMRVVAREGVPPFFRMRFTWDPLIRGNSISNPIFILGRM